MVRKKMFKKKPLKKKLTSKSNKSNLILENENLKLKLKVEKMKGKRLLKEDERNYISFTISGTVKENGQHSERHMMGMVGQSYGGDLELDYVNINNDLTFEAEGTFYTYDDDLDIDDYASQISDGISENSDATFYNIADWDIDEIDGEEYEGYDLSDYVYTG